MSTTPEVQNNADMKDHLWWAGWVVRDRTLLPHPSLPQFDGASPTKFNAVRLETLRDHLRAMEKAQNPTDRIENLSNLRVEFRQGKLVAFFTATNGRASQEMYISETAVQQLATEVLPARFFRGLKELAEIDGAGEGIATQAWNKFASQLSSDRNVAPNLVRMIRMRLNGAIHEVVRSCHSRTYAPYSNLQFVEDLLAHAGELTKLHLVSVVITDSVMRLRFVVLDESDYLYLLSGEDPMKVRPTQMIEAWNSEVGRRTVGLHAGLWRPICTNAVCHWSDKTDYAWQHRGRMGSIRIQNGVQNAVPSLIKSADEVLAAYAQAKNVEIGPVEDWLLDKLGRIESVSNDFVAKAREAVKHASTTPGQTLATGIDAITLAAQSYSVVQQDGYERIAANLLHAGLRGN